MADSYQPLEEGHVTNQPINEVDPEIAAISAVYAALKDLQPEAQSRVLNYVAAKLKISGPTPEVEALRHEALGQANHSVIPESGVSSDETIEGISPVAKKWMARNGLTQRQLSAIFSLGVDEIDLIAKSVPGTKKTQRARNVFLLKGVAAYLGTGAARFTHEQVKEACLHYDAFDAPNFSRYVETLSSEVSGNRETGYTLTARGLVNATELLKEMTQ